MRCGGNGGRGDRQNVPFLISSSFFPHIFPSISIIHLFIDLFLCFHCLRSFIKAGPILPLSFFPAFLASLPFPEPWHTLLTGWFKGEHYSAGDEIISFLSSTALFPLLMGSPAASEARGERRVLRKKQLASNMRLTLRSCGRGSRCFQHQMISDLGP